MTKNETLKLALEALETYYGYMEPLLTVFGGPRVPAEQSTTWKVEQAITAIKEALSQPDQYAKGYADAMNWKVQNHIEHLPAAQKLAEWKLVPKKPTEEMLKAMDECSTEGYDERLYAGHAASVYMAAVDVASTPPQRTWVGLTGKDIIEMWPQTSTVGWDDIRLIEAKLKEKNA